MRNKGTKSKIERNISEEEARKEEIKQYIKEKWKRIAELERLASPDTSSEESNTRTRESIIKGAQKRASRASSVEYDPENPFDDDKSREEPKKESIQTMSIKKESSSAPLKRNALDESLRRNASVTKLLPETSVRSVENRRSQAVLPPSRERPRSDTKSSKERSPEKTSLVTVRPRREDRQARTEIVRGNQVVSSARVVPNSVQAPAKSVEKTKEQVKASSSKDHIMTKSSSHESVLSRRTSTLAAVVGRVATNSGWSDLIAAEDTEKKTATMDKSDSPRRRKRRSEVPHHSPSVLRDTSPLALSVETTNALAELEASLARLKSQSSSAAYGTSESRPRRSSVPKDDPVRSRRSLSPAKEMRQLELERSKEEEQQQQQQPFPAKMSFLQRIEMTRGEGEEQEHGSKIGSRLYNKEAVSTEQKKVDERVEQKTEKRFKRHSYVPTRQQETGASDESSCSIMIGDESIDDMVRQNRSSRFMRGVRVLVDVRDQDGEDASSGWIEKLRNVGAKVYTKVPSSSSTSSTSSSSPATLTQDITKQSKLTHIVFKNGRPSTLHYLRSLSQSQGINTIPIVVGVNWILQCLQQGTKIDERDFLVEVGKQAIFNKPRTSMTSKRAPSLEDRNGQKGLAELLAKKKTIQRAPAQPSPLAKRCWNMDASTNSSVSGYNDITR